ncbi:MAG: BrnT family toxin [Granulosicoccus sp.]
MSVSYLGWSQWGFEDSSVDYGEPRVITFGLLVGRLVVIAPTPKDDKTRIISMRKGNTREQKKYSQRLEKS